MGNANQTWGMDLVLTGERLRMIRREHHMSQDALVDHLIALRDLYGCTLDELVVSRQRSRDTDDRDQLVPLKSNIYCKVSICKCVCSSFSL